MDNIKLCKMINAAVQDETDAIKMYGDMAKLLSKGGDKETALKIQADEKRHFGIVSSFKTTLCMPKTFVHNALKKL